MTQVLLAGGCGFIGSHLADKICLRPDVTRLVVVDNLWTGRLENLAALADPRVEFVQSDVETFFVGYKVRRDLSLGLSRFPAMVYWRSPCELFRPMWSGALNLLSLLKPGGVIGYTSTSKSMAIR
jgi:nucleoside-diphosphate-sugar epimerase